MVDQILNEQRYDLLDEFMTDNVEFYGTGPTITGLTALKKWFAMFGNAFPDWHTTINDMVAEGDKVAVRIFSSGTHQGELESIPATGKAITQSAIVIYRLINGKIVEGRLETDSMKMMQQMGLIPSPPSSKKAT